MIAILDPQWLITVYDRKQQNNTATYLISSSQPAPELDVGKAAVTSSEVDLIVSADGAGRGPPVNTG